jgi:hypothetical protein
VDQAVGDVFADAVTAFDCPYPVRIPPAGGEHLGVAGLVGGVPADRQDPGPFVDDFDRG